MWHVFIVSKAVEKYLKAFLTYHNQRVGKTHDIGRLLQMCIEIDKEFESMDREKIESLSIFAVELGIQMIFICLQLRN
jgi:HEPN domain-containing protein